MGGTGSGRFAGFCSCSFAPPDPEEADFWRPAGDEVDFDEDCGCLPLDADEEDACGVLPDSGAGVVVEASVGAADDKV